MKNGLVSSEIGPQAAWPRSNIPLGCAALATHVGAVESSRWEAHGKIAAGKGGIGKLDGNTRLNCYQVISSQRLNATEFQVSVRSMMGSHPDFIVSQISYTPRGIEDIPYDEHCYLYTRNNGPWITVHPYVQFKDCPLCHHPRVLLADGQQYLDCYAGHRVNLA